MPDVVKVIKGQHRRLTELLEQAQQEESDTAELLQQVKRLLTPHSEAEESFVYPRISELNPRETDEVHDGTAEHHHVEELLNELLDEDPDGPGFDGKLAAMVGELQHHIDEEEDELLPVLTERADDSERDAMGDRFVTATGSDGSSSAQHDATRDELYQEAKERDIAGRSSMTKDELAAAVEQAE